MLSLIFPRKKHPEDTNESLALIAKMFLVFGLFSLCWSGSRLYTWVKSYSYASTPGTLVHDTRAWHTSRLHGAAYRYTVDGTEHESEEIAIGGRPFGAIPPPGEVTVYYDPAKPAKSVLQRRPVETTWIAIACGLIAPFIARYLWDLS